MEPITKTSRPMVSRTSRASLTPRRLISRTRADRPCTRQLEAVGPEGIRLDPVGARLDVLGVDALDDLGLVDVEHVEAGVERHAARVEHGAHGAVAEEADARGAGRGNAPPPSARPAAGARESAARHARGHLVGVERRSSPPRGPPASRRPCAPRRALSACSRVLPWSIGSVTAAERALVERGEIAGQPHHGADGAEGLEAALGARQPAARWR
mgnify:CR=1 FL=1